MSSLQVQRLIGARPNAGQQGKAHHSSSPERDVDDFYATAPESIEALLKVEIFDGPIWEPACGQGHISNVLAAAGYQVINTELVDRRFGETGVDFLMEWKPRAPNIVTNPPFKLASDFVRTALRLTTGKVAMLLKIGFLEGVGRADIFDAAPLARVWVFRRRQSFLKAGIHKTSMNGRGGMIAYAWFVWEHGYTGKPTLGWI
jgi:hypothetical protein